MQKEWYSVEELALEWGLKEETRKQYANSSNKEKPQEKTSNLTPSSL